MRPNRIERERREKERRRRGRGRGRKEIKQAKIKGMELHGLLKLGIVFHTIAWLLVCSQKPRVLFGFLPDLEFLKVSLVKP